MNYFTGFVGTTHKAWIRHPLVFALCSLAYALALSISSELLSIWDDFGNENKLIGFGTSNWGFLYPWLLPLVIFFIGFLFHTYSRAIISLDKIIIPKNKNSAPFSNWLQPLFSKGWNIIVYTSIILSITLVLFADGGDIIKPLDNNHRIINPVSLPSIVTESDITSIKSDTTKIIEHKDWTTDGFRQNSDRYWVYFIFNITAFFMEGVLAYCGLIILLGTSAMIFKIINFLSILEQKRKDSIELIDIDKKEITDLLNNYDIKWDWKGLRGRCGLHEFDKIYISYVAFIALTILASGISVIANIGVYGDIDKGSWVLIISTIIIFPCSFIWIMYPYWSYFPDRTPDEPEFENLLAPQKWPLGDKFGLIFISFVTTMWVLFITKALSKMLN